MKAQQTEKFALFAHYRQYGNFRLPLLHKLDRLSERGVGLYADGIFRHYVGAFYGVQIHNLLQHSAQVTVGDKSDKPV